MVNYDIETGEANNRKQLGSRRFEFMSQWKDNDAYQLLSKVTITSLLKDIKAEKDKDRIRKKETHEKAIADQQELLVQLNQQKFSSVVERKKALDDAKRKLVDLKSQSPRFSPMQLIAMKDTDSLDMAIKTLTDNNILSIPVSSAATTQLRGFVDMLDIVYYMQRIQFNAEKDGKEKEQKDKDQKDKDQKDKEEKEKEEKENQIDTLPKPPPLPHHPQNVVSTAEVELKKSTLADVLGALGRVPVEIEETKPASTLIQLFTSGERRACILSHDKRAILGIISQSDVVRHLQSLLKPTGAFARIGNSTIKELGHGVKPIVAVFKKQTVAEALSLLSGRNVSSLAVVEDPKPSTTPTPTSPSENGSNNSSSSSSSGSSSGSYVSNSEYGKLVGNFSASDFRFITHDHFKKFKVTSWRVDTFLGSVHSHSLEPITIKPTDSLTKVVDLICNNSFHHIWVSDDDLRPVGIVSLTDIMKMLCSYAPKE